MENGAGRMLDSRLRGNDVRNEKMVAKGGVRAAGDGGLSVFV